MTQAPLTREQIQEQNSRGLTEILDVAGSAGNFLLNYLFGTGLGDIDRVNQIVPEQLRIPTPNASTTSSNAPSTPSDVPNVIQKDNPRGPTGPATMSPDAPPPRQPSIADATTTLVDKITDPEVRRKLLEIEYEQIKKRDADIARYRLEGQQEVTRRQAQNNVINAWKDVEVATIEKERAMALGLAEIAYRSSMPNPAVMQQLNAAAQVGASAFGNKPLLVQ